MITVTRAITLTEPWATLMALNEKHYETRSWETRYKGWIAIHAAKGFPADCRALCSERPFIDALTRGGINNVNEFRLGHVIAVGDLYSCRRTEDLMPTVSEQEQAFGNFSAGRFAFGMNRVWRLREPFPVRGMLGIWKLPRPITEADLV